MVKIAVFASGQGTNTANLIQYFKKSELAQVSLVITNNPNAPVIQKARSLGVETLIIDDVILKSEALLSDIQAKGINIIVLAGFLKLIPSSIISAYPNRVVNIHPSLLPKFGGKGMYGIKVHEAVIASGEDRSGITIHFVDKNFDEGKIIASYQTNVEENDTPLTLMHKVRELELKHFPIEVEKLISKI